MSEKRFKIYQDSIRKFESNRIWGVKSETNYLEPYMTFEEAEKCCELLNKQQDQISYWKNKAMTLLMQVRRLTSRMTDKEVKEFSKELEE